MTEQQMIDEGYTDGKKSFEYQWDKISAVFDWDKVYKVMKALDWHWHIHEEDFGIPRIDKIKNVARKLAYEAWERELDTIQTGGFFAGYEEGDLWIHFVIEDMHTADC